MNLIRYIYNQVIFFLIFSISYGFSNGCMDNGYQSWSPNFGSPACNYDADATVKGDCFYPDCNECFPDECSEQNDGNNCEYIGNIGSFRCSIVNQRCSIGDSLFLDELQCIENSGIWFSNLYLAQGECLYSNEQECIINNGNWSLYVYQNEYDCTVNNGVWFRDGLDECEVCGGDNSDCYDCNNDSNGNAYIDACDICVDGNTSIVDEFSIDMSENLIEEGLSQKNISVDISNTGILNSLYIEIEYDTTFINNINFTYGSDINTSDYQIDYNHLLSNRLDHMKTQLNIFYRPIYFDCSIYSYDLSCQEEDECSWNELEDVCERVQKPIKIDCGDKKEVFQIILDSKSFYTNIDSEPLIILNALELNEKKIAINQNNEGWNFGVISIYDPSLCDNEQACNYNNTGYFYDVKNNDQCEFPGDENWPGCDCIGNTIIDDCGICNGTQLDGDTNGDLNICEIDCPAGEILDCNNECGGSAQLDECNICAGGNTGLIVSKIEYEDNSSIINSYFGAYDCTGVCSGTAYIDGCDECIDIISGDQDCLKSQIDIIDQINDSTFAITDTISNSKIFYASIYMQNLPKSLEGIILGLDFNKDILNLKSASLDPSSLGLEKYVSSGELQNSYNYYQQISDSSLLAAILIDTNISYNEEFGYILFLEFEPNENIVPKSTTSIEYSQLQINENSMTEDKINSFSQIIYFGDCNGSWNGIQTDEDGDGICSDRDECIDTLPGVIVGPNGCDAPLSIDPKQTFLPSNFSISQNFPNPFNPITYIEYTVPIYSNIEIDIIDISGKIINTIVNSLHQPGNYKIMWDGKNRQGRPTPSGIYFYKMDTGNFISVKKLVLLK